MALAEWRLANPGALLDLDGADLKFAKLPDVDFRDANPRNANLVLTELSEADFAGADL